MSKQELVNALKPDYDGSGPVVMASYVEGHCEGEPMIVMATLMKPIPPTVNHHTTLVQVGTGDEAWYTVLTAEQAIAFGRYLVQVGDVAKRLDSESEAQ